MNYRSFRNSGEESVGPRRIGETLDALTKRLGLAPPDSLSKVFAGWDGLVGVLLASHIRPVGLRDGVLTVEVTEPAWATQLKFLGDDLIRRVNEQVGVGTVSELAVRVVGTRRGKRESD
jgi:predicted nucleic acid-binding Zn ribbon protein